MINHEGHPRTVILRGGESSRRIVLEKYDLDCFSKNFVVFVSFVVLIRFFYWVMFLESNLILVDLTAEVSLPPFHGADR